MKIVDYLMIGATIRIGRQILCLPYAGFFQRSLSVDQSPQPPLTIFNMFLAIFNYFLLFSTNFNRF